MSAIMLKELLEAYPAGLTRRELSVAAGVGIESAQRFLKAMNEHNCLASAGYGTSSRGNKPVMWKLKLRKNQDDNA